MGIMSVSVPENLRKRMLELDEVNWSAVARKAFEDKVKEVEILKRIASKSKFTVRDAENISKDISERMARKYRNM